MKNFKTTSKTEANGSSAKAKKVKIASKRKANTVEEHKSLTDEERKAKKIKLKKELNKIASVDELNQLQSSEKLYHSNFFHLQIEELLKEVKLKSKYETFSNEWVTQLTEFIASIDTDATKVAASELSWLKKNKSVVPPISDDTPWAKSEFFFQFLQPKSIVPIGSLRTSTVISSNPVLDVCLEIPAEFFQKNNHLNGIYHQKRALYLSYIALKLNQWDQVTDCEFAFVRGDPLRPVVRVKPAGKYGKHLTIDLHAVCSEESFKLERFLPEKSNVKQLQTVNEKKPKDQGVAKNEEHTATPHYNSSILRDLTTIFNDEFLANSVEATNVRDAIVLLKVWLRQRGLDAGIGGMSGYILTAFVAYLLTKNRINLSMNSYQIIRQVWIAFGCTAWNEDGKSISLYENKFPTSQPSLGDFHKVYDVVFVDVTGFYNICSSVSLDVYLRVRHESENSLKILNDEHVNSFRCLFVAKAPIYLQLDHVVSLDSRINIPSLLEKYGTTEEMFDYSGYWYPHILKILFRVLRRGLGQRAEAILPVNQAKSSAWSVKLKPPTTEKRIQFGLILNPDNAFDILDKGPQSNLPEAEDFRQFWGSKSELRRFQDGSITEACVWGALTASLVEKRLACKHIVVHLLDHHFKISANHIKYIATELDTAFELHNTYTKYKGSQNNSENLSVAVIKSFDELAKCLRSLDGLPLVVTSVLGKSPVFRYCELNPILPNARFTHDDSQFFFNAYSINEGVIQFENSGKWPNDLAAIRRVKAAFYIQIARALRTNFNLKTKGNADCVDVIKDYFLFRFTIAVPREVALLKKEVTQKGVTKYRDTPESLHLERDTVLLPKLTVSLHSLYHQHSSFGPTVLIAKRWLYSQLLDQSLWPDECTEMLVAHQYLYSKTNASNQPQTGFFRFLHMLAHTNWKTDLILLNFNDDISTDAVSKLETKFIAERDSFPPLCIATSCGEADKHIIWTKKVPTVEVLARVTVLARHAITLVQENLFEHFEAKTLFETSLDGYDVVINLKKQFIRDNFLNDFKNTKKSAYIEVPPANYNPVESYLKELRSAFDHVAVFFYNPIAGENIAVLWKPITQSTHEFRLAAINGQRSADGKLLSYDRQQIIGDFHIIGHGLVESIRSK